MSIIRFDIITIFPKIFGSYFNESIVARAIKKNKIQIKIWNLRDFSKDKHHKVDDRPFGGGAGMVLEVEPILRAVNKIKPKAKAKVIVLSAKGKQFTQKMAYDWSKKFNNLILISGRYEGIDERVKIALKAEEVSMGPYVLTDGEVPAMAIISAVTRLIPNVINWDSLQDESYFRKVIKEEKDDKVGNLEYPHYTRPEIIMWKNKKYSVPKVLLSGNHKKIEEWRKTQRKRG